MHVRLTDRSRNPVDALLISDVSYDQIAQADEQWRAIKRTHRLGPGSPLEWLSESHEWDWTRKFVEQRLDHSFLAVECEGTIQGLLQLTMTPRASRLPNCKGAKTLYIDHIESAPWNQKEYSQGGVRRFGRVVTLL